MQTRRRFLTSLAAISAMPIIQRAWASDYPSRSITIVVPYAAGGSSDSAARLLADRMRAWLGQPAIVENVSGAAGNIGVGRVARAGPDGYTLVEGNWSTHVANGAIYSLPYDPSTDFAPIALIASSPLVICARKSMPANSLKELIVWLKSNPDKASQGTNGSGSIMHVAGIFFQRETGTRFQFVPYRAGSLAVQDLLGGQIDFLISTAPDVVSLARSRTIQVYAVTSKTRLNAVPDIPSVDEVGLPGFYVTAWWGLWAPRRTPQDVIAKLNSAAVGALSDPAVRHQFAELGWEIPPREQQTAEMLGAFQRAEIDKWWPIIKAAGIKPE
jgi:tripartite-type tricarboxylate transporter receptor subunit TctC